MLHQGSHERQVGPEVRLAPSWLAKKAVVLGSERRMARPAADDSSCAKARRRYMAVFRACILLLMHLLHLRFHRRPR